jgi:2,4-dienoyl-CoA reductase (NADPH2)
VVKGTEIENLPGLIEYYEHQLKSLGVKLKLGQEVTAATIAAEKPEAVIIAAGGAQATPDIKGISSKNVVSNTALHKQLKSILRFMSPEMLRGLTKFYLPIGKRVVVIGGALQGCELAEFFTRRGRQVTVIDTAEKLGQGMVDAFQGYLFAWFKRKGVRLEAGVKNIEITEKGVSFTTKDGKKETLAADTVVAAMPLAPNMALYESLKGKVPELYAIGDCKEPLLIMDAIGTGMEAARKI